MAGPLDAIRKATLGAPYEGNLWLVGGAVRDELLGQPHTDDYDIVLEGDALALARRLSDLGIASTVPVEYARFGTAMVHVHGSVVEFVSARKESYDASSRKPNVQPGTLLEDIQRRDFTVNALLKNLHTGDVVDLLGMGIQDLRNGILRTPLEPGLTFRDDPLRMLRAVRFRHRLIFSFAPGLAESIEANALRLNIVSAERIREEWLKMLARPSGDDAMRDLLNLGLLEQFAPEFLPLVGMDHGRYHHLDVWEHTLLVYRNLFALGEPSQNLILAALFHDIGKPLTRSVGPDGALHFYEHERVGAELAREVLTRLRFSNQTIHEVCTLIRQHMRFGGYDRFSDTAARRVIRDLGDLLPDLLTLVEADRNAHHPDMPHHDLAPVRERIEAVKRFTPATKLVSPLSGKEIMELTGLPSGSGVGRIKQLLADLVVEGTLAPDDVVQAREIVLSMQARG